MVKEIPTSGYIQISLKMALPQIQGAKKVIFTACNSGKLKLAFISPNVISTSPLHFLMSRIDFRVPL